MDLIGKLIFGKHLQSAFCGLDNVALLATDSNLYKFSFCGQ